MPMAYPCCRSIELNFQSVGCCYFNCTCTTVPGFFSRRSGDTDADLLAGADRSQPTLPLLEVQPLRVSAGDDLAKGLRPEQRCENHEAEHLTAHLLTRMPRKYGRSASVKMPYLLHSVLRGTQEWIAVTWPI